MNAEDEERMMYYARVTFAQAKQSQTTLQIIEELLSLILVVGVGGVTYMFTEDKTYAITMSFVMGAISYYLHWRQHEERKTKQFDI